MGMLLDLKWDTLETISRYARMSVMCKMCYGFQDNKRGKQFDFKERKENTRKP